MNLPANQHLSIEKQTQVFQKMTSSYKALLFRSVLDFVNDERNDVCDDGGVLVSYSDLCAGMLLVVVYPLQVFPPTCLALDRKSAR